MNPVVILTMRGGSIGYRYQEYIKDQESAIEHLLELSKEYHREWMSKRKKVDDYREKHFFERFDAVEDGRPFMSLMNRTEGTDQLWHVSRPSTLSCWP